MKPLLRLRARIDRVDRQLACLLSRRARLVREAFARKRAARSPLYDARRMAEIPDRIERENRGPLSGREIRGLFSHLLHFFERQFRLAASIKNPAPDRTSNRPALEQFGKRLTLRQVNTRFESFQPEMHTITGQRDLALLYLGITSGLRAAEIARITLDSITPGDDCYEIRVRGKRANHDPIGIDSTAYALLQSYVAAFNTRLLDSVPPLQAVGRGLGGGDPIFQPLLRGDHLPANLDLTHGISARAILKIVERRTAAALGSAITAHDMRRTCAYLMRSHGFEWDQIRAQLRHRSIGTTEKYVGKAQDLFRALLSKRAHFTIPHQ